MKSGRQETLRRERRGFTLVEAMVSTVLLAVGITAVLGAFSSMTSNYRKARDTEQMQRLALDKYEELVATGSLQTQTLNGDFSDRGNDRYLWDASVETTGVENLSSLTITVQPRDNQETEPKVSIDGVVFIEPATTAPAGGTP
jgi:prepilin-type N-terminal cleavage/methylation domain-containing protein